MSVRALLIFVLVYLHLFAGSVSSAYLSDSWMAETKYMMSSYNMAKHIEDNYKETLHLKYRDFKDLQETCVIVTKFCQYNKDFKKSDILSLIITESKLDQFARNKNDGGVGLGQITGLNKWWKEELFWIKNPYDKHQNIAAIFIVLNCFKKTYGTKHLAIKHYNGSTAKSERYAKNVEKLSVKLNTINVI